MPSPPGPTSALYFTSHWKVAALNQSKNRQQSLSHCRSHQFPARSASGAREPVVWRTHSRPGPRSEALLALWRGWKISPLSTKTVCSASHDSDRSLDASSFRGSALLLHCVRCCRSQQAATGCCSSPLSQVSAFPSAALKPFWRQCKPSDGEDVGRLQDK